jgi:hypothetical protein
MNSKRTVVVAEGRANRVCTAREEHRASVWLRVMAVEANATSVVEGRGRSVTTGGDEAYDITHEASWIHTAGGATQQNEAKAAAATEGRRGGMQRRGRNQIVRRSARRDRAAVTYRQRHANTETRSVSPHRKWRSRNMAREGGNTATDYLEGWDPTLTCWQLLRRITKGLASNTMSLSLLLDRARPMTWCDVDPMAITPISSRSARADLCGVFTR